MKYILWPYINDLDISDFGSDLFPKLVLKYFKGEIIMTIPRMRTAKELAKELKLLDPDTCLTESSIRRLVKENKLKSISVGKKRLINFDDCIYYLRNPFSELTLNDQSDDRISQPCNITPQRMDEYTNSIGMKKSQHKWLFDS